MFKDKNIHLIGIGGVSMSSIALMLQNLGANVTGSDINNTDITANLEKKGIKIIYNHQTDLVKNADIVIYTAAISDEDPEKIAIKEYNKKGYERAEFLGILMESYKNSLCISGTHGKSTTTGMVSLIFLSARKDPTIQVGAMLRQIDGNTHIGSKEYFILEACEYVDSFLHFHPTGIIVTNIDNDHLDYFKNLDNIKKSFQKYVSLLPENGFLVKNNDDENSNGLENYTHAQVITYGINNEATYTAKNISFNDLGHYSFDIYKDNSKLITINLNVSGYHNIYNALGAFALAHAYIADLEAIKTGLEKYSGVGRRFEYLGKYNNALVFDDYAHHPSEVKTTVESVNKIKHNHTWAVFQSHTFSRTKDHLDDFAKILSEFENVIIAPIYPARETNIFNISESMLVDKIKTYGNENVIYIDSFEKIIDYLKENVQENDLVISIGAGPVNKVTKKLIELN